MNDPSQSEKESVKPAAGEAPHELHSLQDLPESLGQVSSGPFGAVARKDHTSWKTRAITDPAYWSGRVDCALGERIHCRPIPSVAICFGAGVIFGLLVSFTANGKSR